MRKDEDMGFMFALCPIIMAKHVELMVQSIGALNVGFAVVIPNVDLNFNFSLDFNVSEQSGGRFSFVKHGRVVLHMFNNVSLVV